MVLRNVLVIQRNWNNFTPFFIPTAFVVLWVDSQIKA